MTHQSDIVIGYEPDFAPLTFLEQGRSCGLVIDLLKEIFGRLGVSTVYMPVVLAEQDDAVQSGNIDAIAFKAIIPERAGAYEFSLPLAVSGAAWFVLRHDFTGRFTPAPDASIATPTKGPLLGQLRREFPDASFPMVQTYSEALAAVAESGADCAALNFHVGCYLADRDYQGRFALPEAPFLKTPLGLVLGKNKKTGLLEDFNKVLQDIQATGRADAIESKWLAK